MSNDLKTQFLNYMTINRFSRHTQKNYILAVKGLARFYNQPPDALSGEQIQNCLLYLIQEKKQAWGSVNNMLCGLSCFYKNVLKWDEVRWKIPPRPRIKKLPTVLSEEEVRRLFAATDNLKHRVLLKTVYSAGLRLSEAICLRPEHIESDPSRMMIRVEQGKGKKTVTQSFPEACSRNCVPIGVNISPVNGYLPGKNETGISGLLRCIRSTTGQKKSRHYQGSGYPCIKTFLCHSPAVSWHRRIHC